jgi:hypothetical protein
MSEAAVITLSNDANAAAASLQIRSRVRNAADAIAPVWPLKTFIACNPLQGFEGLPFEEAVKEGEALFGGRGYRPAEEYRKRYAKGEIAAAALEAAIQRRLAGTPATMSFGGKTLAADDILFAHVAHGPAPVNSPPASALGEAARAAVAALDHRHGEAEGDDARVRWQWRPDRETVAAWIDRVSGTRLMPEINRHAIKWCAAFLDEGQAAMPMPGREAGFFAAWRRLAAHDASTPGLAEMIAALPASADACIVSILDAMGIAEAESEVYLRAHLAALPGWAGFIKWRADSPSYAWQKKYPADLVEYLAIRLSIEQALIAEHAGKHLGCQPTVGALAARLARTATAGGLKGKAAPAAAASPAASLHQLARQLPLSPQSLAKASPEEVQAILDLIQAWPEERHAEVWLEAAEETYRDHLAAALAPAAAKLAGGIAGKPQARAQLVFCIDVRSEPFRRALEQVGAYETYGFAGFFGIPIRFVPFAGEASADLCPVLLQPRHDVTETPDPAATACARRHLAGVAAERRYKSLTTSLKSNIAAPFAFVESVGALSGIAFAGRTIAPLGYGRSVLALKQRLQPQVALSPVLDLTPKNAPCGHDHDHEKEDLWGLTIEEQAFYAAAGAKIMGLSEPFAEFVVLCAHGSTSTNNPYAAALDCGACGGNHGGPNARVMAAIFNRPEVRALLAEQGIEIPASTVFLAAEHNTTTDEVTIFNLDRVPESHRVGLARLQRDLAQARRINAANRRRRLPEEGDEVDGDGADVHVAERSLDWAQVRPEWGLARNAAFIVGPRSLTASTDLDGRCFLHSYDWRIDDDAKSLEIILTAPMVVAQWINCQYYFSTVDNDHYGSGNKITLNITGKIGVMQGNASDLMTGLPWQSVMAAEGQPYHEPLRLMTVVMAPVARLATLIARNTILQRLFDNEWVALLVIDPETGRFLRYRRGRTWNEVTPKVPAAPTDAPEDAAVADALPGTAQPITAGPASASSQIHPVPTIPA